jgi:hypothetical protein
MPTVGLHAFFLVVIAGLVRLGWAMIHANTPKKAHVCRGRTRF